MNMTKYRDAQRRKHVVGIQAVGVLSALQNAGELIGDGTASLCRELVAQWEKAAADERQANEEPWERTDEAAEASLRG